jgi:hypothetical protein
LFGASCPLVVVFAWVTNLVETRTDGVKLLRDYRRVLPNRVDSIGEPLQIFYWTLYAAVPVNCGLVVFTFNAAAWVGDDSKVWVLLLVALFMVAFLAQLDAMYPDVSRKTAVQLARQDVVYKRVILGEPQDDDELDFELTDAMVGVSVNAARHMATARNSLACSPQDFAKMVVTAGAQPEPAASAQTFNPIFGGGTEM